MNILITSVGRRAYMIEYFKSALHPTGLVHASNSVVTYTLQKADHYLITPEIYNADYIEVLKTYCQANQITAILSLFDIDLPILSKHRQEFEEIGVNLLVSKYNLVKTCNDKLETANFLENNGFLTPKTYGSLLEAKKAIKAKEVSFPLIIKPRWGTGSIGIFEAEDEGELNAFYKKAQRVVGKTYLRFESKKDPDKNIVIQEKMIGEEWGVDVFNDLDGHYLACVPKRKLAMRAGETDIAMTYKHPGLMELGNQISKVTKHIGDLDVDLFIKDDNFYILELNCRFGGQYPFAHVAGVNFPKVLLDLLNHKKIDSKDLEFSEIKAFKDLEVRIGCSSIPPCELSDAF